jgi:hypothetical protein
MIIKERPILFSTPMIQAILDARKTQVRQVVKNQYENQLVLVGKKWQHPIGKLWEVANIKCPYGQVGDRLWVRETWHKSPYGIIYKADWERNWGDDNTKTIALDKDGEKVYVIDKWKPSIYMPRSACRILLEITDIRVERLQDISEKDAIAEGVNQSTCPIMPLGNSASVVDWIAGFRLLWDSINAKKHPWASNPWVWVVEFKPVSKPN